MGIGDIFLEAFKHVSQPGTVIKSFTLNEKIIREHRLFPEKYTVFLRWLANTLFPEADLCSAPSPRVVCLPHRITSTRLYKFFPCIKTPIFSEPYLLFHTKVRMDGCYKQSDFETLFTYLSTFHSSIPIVLVGDKVIEQNKEAIIYKIESIYSRLLTSLPATTKIIDVTEESLYSANTVEGFQRDLSLIHNAVCNISFGWGGNCQLIKAVGQASCHFVSTWRSTILDMYKGIKDGDQFFNTIEAADTVMQHGSAAHDSLYGGSGKRHRPSGL